MNNGIARRRLVKTLLMVITGAAAILGPRGSGLLNGQQPKAQIKLFTTPQATSAPPQGNASSAGRLKFAAASVRPGGVPEFGKNSYGINRVKCLGVDGELWTPNLNVVDPTPPRQGRCTGQNVPLMGLLMTAYASSPTVSVVGAPNADLTFYQIEAVADDPSRVTKGELKLMLQALLEDRFKARIHTTTMERDGFALTVAKAGIKFKETSGDEQMVSGKPILRGKYRMDAIVNFLTFLLGPVPIVDKTGLTGLYDMTFMVDEISPQSVDDGGRGGPGGPRPAREFSPPIPKAVEDQLGLHLERAKVPVETLVVDHLERATEN